MAENKQRTGRRQDYSRIPVGPRTEVSVLRLSIVPGSRSEQRQVLRLMYKFSRIKHWRQQGSVKRVGWHGGSETGVSHVSGWL